MKMQEIIELDKITEFILPALSKFRVMVKYDASAAVYKLGLRTVNELLASEGLITDYYITCLSR